MFRQLAVMLRIARAQGIARRYFIVNGFDGALTMLGLISGFYGSNTVDQIVINNACLGAAIALAVSGVSSAWMSEAAEKKRELRELEAAMVADLGESVHAQAARFLPLVIGLINGLAPLLISLVIILSMQSAYLPFDVPVSPLEAALMTALVLIFLLGVFLGQIGGIFWLWAGLRTLLIAIVTIALIAMLGHG
jgi:predicted membrane protein (TIGR00267 family)